MTKHKNTKADLILDFFYINRKKMTKKKMAKELNVNYDFLLRVTKNH